MIGLLLFALAGCAGGLKQALPGVMAQTAPPTIDQSRVGPEQGASVVAGTTRYEVKNAAPVVVATGAVMPQQPVTMVVEDAGIKPAAAVLTLPPSRIQSGAAPPAKAPAKVAAAPSPVIEARSKTDAPLSAARALEPPLDVASLKARLRDTSAIGVFTKLALKNQVDDLLTKFRAHHRSGQKASVASLRQLYDMLVLKVLALVQDTDPSLARTILASREAIWGILADPEKFDSVT